MQSNKLAALAMIASFFLISPAFAEQRLAANERVPQKAAISQKALSRIAIEGSRIREVKYLEGELEFQKDQAAGQIYVRALTSRPSSLFVSSEEGKTYLLILNPSSKKGENIIIDVAGLRQQEAMQAASIPRPPAAVTSKSTDYVRGIKQLMVSMINGTSGNLGIRNSPAYKTIPLWQGVLFVQKGQYTAADMQAESYSLTNTGSDVITLREQEFYKPGVYAVTIIKQVLNPGEMTDVYVVKKLGSY